MDTGRDNKPAFKSFVWSSAEHVLRADLWKLSAGKGKGRSIFHPELRSEAGPSQKEGHFYRVPWRSREKGRGQWRAEHSLGFSVSLFSLNTYKDTEEGRHRGPVPLF